jgi:hypothetical protein
LRVSMTAVRIFQTGQRSCFDENGVVIPCRGSGQDGEYQKGRAWPVPRFKAGENIVEDLLTGLYWTADANLAEFPLTWAEAFAFIDSMNDRTAYGFADWRLPDRNELRSLVSYQARRPALPADHPFRNVYLGWYWTATTAAINPGYAWYVHMDGARMFYGGKEQYYMLWPVRGESGILASAAQHERCGSRAVNGSNHQFSRDTAVEKGHERRFMRERAVVHDRMTGLCWLQKADLSEKKVTWAEALQMVAAMNNGRNGRKETWRLPNINELESLVDCSIHNPALEVGHPFSQLRDVYWSSTTSFFEPDWAWALYLNKGALGVGYKKKPEFFVWPVCDL